MPKDAPKDTPEVQSRENAIEARAFEPSRTPSGDGPGAMPSGSPDWEAILAGQRPGTVSTAQQERHTGDIHAVGSVPELTASHPAAPQAMGDVPPTAVSPDPASPEDHAHTRGPLEITKRLQAEGRWKEVEPVRDQMMRESKKRFPDKETRQAWVYAELDRMYPPVQQKQPDCDTGFVDTQGLTATNAIRIANSGTDEGAIQGLSDVPKDWPELPANASLAAELGWVQANRLFMVEERPGKATRVRLDQAASPAPSRAALGWLETSIRSYAKYVDVAAKVSGSGDDESEVMKRERKSIEEVEALLQEMCEASGACPHCGRKG